MRDLGSIGCIFQAFGPATAYILLKLRHDPQLILIAVCGAFLFVLSMLLSAVWWYMVPPMKNVAAWSAFFGVLWQTLIQFGFFHVYLRIEKGFTTQGEVIFASNFGALPVAAAAGFGFGIAEVFLTFGMFLNNSWNLGKTGATFYDLSRCETLPFLYLQSLLGCFFILLHALWLVALFAGLTALTHPNAAISDGYTPLAEHAAASSSHTTERLFPRNSLSRTQGYAVTFAAVVLHLFGSLSTSAECTVSLPLVALDVVLSVALALYCARVCFSPFSPLPRPMNKDYRARVAAMYQKYQPDKMPNIDALMAKAVGREEALIEALVSKYGPEPPMATTTGGPTVGAPPATERSEETPRQKDPIRPGPGEDPLL